MQKVSLLSKTLAIVLVSCSVAQPTYAYLQDEVKRPKYVFGVLLQKAKHAWAAGKRRSPGISRVNTTRAGLGTLVAVITLAALIVRKGLVKNNAGKGNPNEIEMDVLDGDDFLDSIIDGPPPSVTLTSLEGDRAGWTDTLRAKAWGWTGSLRRARKQGGSIKGVEPKRSGLPDEWKQ